MIGGFDLKGCGPLASLQWTPGPGLNVVIGENSTGKTMLLKLLYVLVRSLEEFGLNDDARPFRDIVGERLRWTYQVRKLGAIVTRGQTTDHLRFEGPIDDQPMLLRLSKQADLSVTEVLEQVTRREATSLFLPAKEVVSLAKVIRSSRLVDRQFGFDDTYLDLIMALDKEPTVGKHAKEVADARGILSAIAGGEIDLKNDEWSYRRNGDRYPISVTAEGVRKIGIIKRLLGSRTLTTKSVLFVDEPEAALHPSALIALLDALGLLAHRGMQVVMATHSFIALKKLQLLARQHGSSVPVLSLCQGVEPSVSDLADGMPSNPIVDASLRLYREEVGLRTDG